MADSSTTVPVENSRTSEIPNPEGNVSHNAALPTLQSAVDLLAGVLGYAELTAAGVGARVFANDMFAIITGCVQAFGVAGRTRRINVTDPKIVSGIIRDVQGAGVIPVRTPVAQTQIPGKKTRRGKSAGTGSAGEKPTTSKKEAKPKSKRGKGKGKGGKSAATDAEGVKPQGEKSPQSGAPGSSTKPKPKPKPKGKGKGKAPSSSAAVDGDTTKVPAAVPSNESGDVPKPPTNVPAGEPSQLPVQTPSRTSTKDPVKQALARRRQNVRTAVRRQIVTWRKSFSFVKSARGDASGEKQPWDEGFGVPIESAAALLQELRGSESDDRMLEFSNRAPPSDEEVSEALAKVTDDLLAGVDPTKPVLQTVGLIGDGDWFMISILKKAAESRLRTTDKVAPTVTTPEAPVDTPAKEDEVSKELPKVSKSQKRRLQRKNAVKKKGEKPIPKAKTPTSEQTRPRSPNPFEALREHLDTVVMGDDACEEDINLPALVREDQVLSAGDKAREKRKAAKKRRAEKAKVLSKAISTPLPPSRVSTPAILAKEASAPSAPISPFPVPSVKKAGAPIKSSAPSPGKTVGVLNPAMAAELKQIISDQAWTAPSWKDDLAKAVDAVRVGLGPNPKTSTLVSFKRAKKFFDALVANTPKAWLVLESRIGRDSSNTNRRLLKLMEFALTRVYDVEGLHESLMGRDNPDLAFCKTPSAFVPDTILPSIVIGYAEKAAWQLAVGNALAFEALYPDTDEYCSLAACVALYDRFDLKVRVPWLVPAIDADPVLNDKELEDHIDRLLKVEPTQTSSAKGEVFPSINPVVPPIDKDFPPLPVAMKVVQSSAEGPPTDQQQSPAFRSRSNSGTSLLKTYAEIVDQLVNRPNKPAASAFGGVYPKGYTVSSVVSDESTFISKVLYQDIKPYDVVRKTILSSKYSHLSSLAKGFVSGRMSVIDMSKLLDELMLNYTKTPTGDTYTPVIFTYLQAGFITHEVSYGIVKIPIEDGSGVVHLQKIVRIMHVRKGHTAIYCSTIPYRAGNARWLDGVDHSGLSCLAVSQHPLKLAGQVFQAQHDCCSEKGVAFSLLDPLAMVGGENVSRLMPVVGLGLTYEPVNF